MAQMRGLHGSRLAGFVGLGQDRRAVGALVALSCALAVVGGWRALGGKAGIEVLPAETRDAAALDDADGADDGEDAAASKPEAQTMVVHVDGAVASPGVYALVGPSPRVGDAVELAGGLAEDADTLTVNLASPLVDGQKIYVPHQGEEACSQPTADGLASSAGQGAGLVNVNLATESELQALPGVGEATARAIVEERERGGPFSSVDDLLRVSGIGEKKLERMRSMACV